MTIRALLKNMPRWLKTLFCLAVIGLVFLPIYLPLEHKANVVHQELEQEFASIAILQGSIPIAKRSTHKAGAVLVQTEFETTNPYSRIREYYVADLERNGWRFQREQTLAQMGTRSNVHELTLCKKSYTAHVYSADDASGHSTYWISLTWGTSGC